MLKAEESPENLCGYIRRGRSSNPDCPKSNLTKQSSYSLHCSWGPNALQARCLHRTLCDPHLHSKWLRQHGFAIDELHSKSSSWSNQRRFRSFRRHSTWGIEFWRYGWFDRIDGRIRLRQRLWLGHWNDAARLGGIEGVAWICRSRACGRLQS